MTEVRLVAMTDEQVERLGFVAETLRRLVNDPCTHHPEKFQADLDATRSLAASYESGIKWEEAEAENRTLRAARLLADAILEAGAAAGADCEADLFTMATEVRLAAQPRETVPGEGE